jgi:putative tryptophan/tyrosine transport system substrate-binding protein
MKRREFIAALAGAATGFSWPLAARAQTNGAMRRIGIINYTPRWEAFRNALRELGYVEGRSIAFEYRTAEETPDRIALAVRDLVRLPVDVIAVWGTVQALAAKEATGSIPIVAISIGNPVKSGLMANLARPGGNVTGNTVDTAELTPKRVQVLRDVLPSISKVGFLFNPDNPSGTAAFEDVKTAVATLGLELIPAAVRGAADFDTAFTTIARGQPDALLLTGDAFLMRNAQKILDFTNRYRLPSMFQEKDEVLLGGLVSYGPNISDLFRHGADYADRILRGAKPADLPMILPTKFELVINLKTAKAFGIEISPVLLARADEVIE